MDELKLARLRAESRFIAIATAWLLLLRFWGAAAEPNPPPAAEARRRALPVATQGRSGFQLLSSVQTGITFTNQLSDAAAAENQIRLNGSGVALGDIDGDGRTDIYLCGLERPNALFRNLGNWRFEDVTATAGVALAGQFSSGSALADVDGDHDLDLLVNGVGTGTQLFLNDGKGGFVPAPDSGLANPFGATSLTLADVDGDGDLDLYVANYRTTTIRTTGFALLNVGGRRMIRPEDRNHLEFTPEGRVLEHGEPDRFYRNDGNGRFVPVPWTNGAFLDEDGKPLTKPPFDWGLSAMFRDLNGDGWPDLYVCNDFHSTDKVWLNDRTGRLQLAPRLALRKSSTFSMAVDFGDLNRDGLDDIFVADMLSLHHTRRLMQWAASDVYLPAIGQFDDRPQFDRNTVQLNRGDGTYAEIADYSGLAASDWTWSAVLLDVDLDGYEDVLCATGHMFDTQDLDAEARIQARGPWRRDRIPQKLLLFPKMVQAKVAFRNRGDLTFEPTGGTWGFDQAGVAHGMALGDLDNDGDLDLVVNNLNGSVGVYRNESSAPRVAIRLRGLNANTRGIGARIEVTGGPCPQSQEMIAGGRYLSGDEALRVFATASVSNVVRVVVNWRSGRRSVVERARPNHLYEIDEGSAVALEGQAARREPSSSTAPDQESRTPLKTPALFADASALISHRHHEDPFDEFARQPLLPRKLSQLGPGVAWIDVDADGWDDLVVGAGRGGQLGVFRNDGKGGFEPWTRAPLDAPMTRDQTGLAGLDTADGRSAILAGASNYEDVLTQGGAVREYAPAAAAVRDAVPALPASTGPLALGDVDGDGDLDLFVGGRCHGGRWPEAASSAIYRNGAGRFELDTVASAALVNAGLVSGAVLTDLDADGDPDLVLACEWGPVRMFRNERGAFTEWVVPLRPRRASSDRRPSNSLHRPSVTNLDLRGLWNGVAAGDFDGDGRLDLVVSNWGLNSPYQSAQGFQEGGHFDRLDSAPSAAAALLYPLDLDGNGSLDLIEAHYDRGLGAIVPTRSFSALATAIPVLRDRFRTFAEFNRASVSNILGERFAQTSPLRLTWLASTVFLNRDDHFEVVVLPPEAQFAPAFGIGVADFDGDGTEDILLSQNFFPVQTAASRLDAGRGLLLRGGGRGGFVAIPGQQSGVLVYGEGRGCAVADFDGDGRVDAVMAQNGAETRLLRNVRGRPGLRVRLEGPPANPRGVGASVRLLQGERRGGPVREVHAGSGYWSQDSAVTVLAKPPDAAQLWVRWPGGQIRVTDVPPDAGEVTVNPSGTLRLGTK